MTAETILVAEDEKKIAEILNDYLRNEWYNVSLVSRGDEVIEKEKSMQPALLLTGLEKGADDYICKPFSPREVVARVKAVLRRARPSDAPQRLIVGPIVLDENTRQVTIEGSPLSLTPSEFGLLNVMIASPERVFSRGELLDRVQGNRFEGYGYDRTIDSHFSV